MSDQPTEHRSIADAQRALYAALARAQADVRAAPKDGTNSYHRYDYATTEGMIAVAKGALGEHGLALWPSQHFYGPHPAIEGQLNLHSLWLLTHVAGGAREIEVQWPVVPERGRPLDKALAGARTSSLNYLLRDLLQIPRVDPSDEMDHADRDRQRDERSVRGPDTSRGRSSADTRPPRGAAAASPTSQPGKNSTQLQQAARSPHTGSETASGAPAAIPSDTQARHPRRKPWVQTFRTWELELPGLPECCPSCGNQIQDGRAQVMQAAREGGRPGFVARCLACSWKINPPAVAYGLGQWDASWTMEVAESFIDALKAIGLTYAQVKKHLKDSGNGDRTPACWAPEDRARFLADLTSGKLPELYAPDVGADVESARTEGVL